MIKDEALGPVQYAEKLYKKAAKHRRAVEQLQPLLDEASTQLEYVADVENNISQLERFVELLITLLVKIAYFLRQLFCAFVSAWTTHSIASVSHCVTTIDILLSEYSKCAGWKIFRTSGPCRKFKMKWLSRG